MQIGYQPRPRDVARLSGAKADRVFCSIVLCRICGCLRRHTLRPDVTTRPVWSPGVHTAGTGGGRGHGWDVEMESRTQRPLRDRPLASSP